MPSLLDPPARGEARLLEIVARGFMEAEGEWPVWQWVRAMLDRESIDPEATLTGLPKWRNGYRPVHVATTGGLPDLDSRIILTMHGLVHARSRATDLLVPPFLAALAEAQDMQDDINPHPARVVSLEINGANLTTLVNKRAGANISPKQLFEMLNREPATWVGLQETGSAGEFVWDLTRPQLRRYQQLKSGEAYLAALEDVVGVSAVSADPPPFSPLSLPEAFDNLDLAWRLATGKRLLRVPRATLVARLTLPVVNAEDFQSRLSAVSDLISNLAVPQGDLEATSKSLARLDAELKRRLPDGPAGALDAVKTLRHVSGLRNSQQHQGSTARYDRARAALGLRRFESDWPKAWEHLATATVTALVTLRDELTRTLDNE
jgi:hypothetical protein